MYSGVLKNFDNLVQDILEGFNVHPRPRAIQGRQAPVPGPSVDGYGGAGALPTGFKGSGPAGIAPSNMATILLPVPKKKKKKKKFKLKRKRKRL
jgi:hypothetical protein